MSHAGRLAYLRAQIEDERISTAEIAELQGLAEHIDPADTLLLEWAGVPEHEEDKEEESWRRADRAATALAAHFDATQGCEPGMGESYGDEGSDTFREAVVELLVDLKHLLWRADNRLMLEDLAQEAVDRWAAEDEEEEEPPTCPRCVMGEELVSDDPKYCPACGWQEGDKP